MRPFLPSLSLIAVVGRTAPSAADLHQFAARLARKAVDFEIILVANGSGGATNETTLALKTLVGAVPDLSVVFLAEDVHDDVARLVGIEHAVGDFVLFCDLARDDPGELRSVLAPLRDGYDLVFAARPGPKPRSLLHRLLLERLCGFYGRMIGASITLEPTGMRVFSRAAALHVAACPGAELRLRARDLGPSFPALAVPLAAAVERRRRPRGRAWTDGIGLLLSVSTLPLRSASYAAALGGGASALYSLYVFAVFLLQPNVAPGWTTLSLQLSGTLFVFSIVLLFLSEQVIQINAAAPPRSRRSLVVRELRSPLSRRRQALNVVDADGVFQLGKPAWLDVPA
jgi:hypothetical protein